MTNKFQTKWWPTKVNHELHLQPTPFHRQLSSATFLPSKSISRLRPTPPHTLILHKLFSSSWGLEYSIKSPNRIARDDQPPLPDGDLHWHHHTHHRRHRTQTRSMKHFTPYNSKLNNPQCKRQYNSVCSRLMLYEQFVQLFVLRDAPLPCLLLRDANMNQTCLEGGMLV